MHQMAEFNQSVRSPKDQAKDFVRYVREDDDRVDEISNMSLQEYADERGKEVIENPRRRNAMKRKRSTAAQDAGAPLRANPEVLISELQSDNAELRRKLSVANSKLDEVDDILSSNNPDYNESDQLRDIQDAH